MGRIFAVFVLALVAAVASGRDFPAPGPAGAPSWKWKCSNQITVGGSSGWSIKNYSDITGAKVGDILAFNWQGSHSVHKMKSNSCDFNGAIFLESTNNLLETFLGYNPPSSFSFKYVLDSAGEHYFADGSSNNCRQGALVKVIVK